MRRHITKLFAMFLTAVLAVSLQANCIFAENNNNAVKGAEEISGLPSSVKPAKEIKLDADKAGFRENVSKSEAFIAEKIQAADKKNYAQVSTKTPSAIYYGTRTGHLSGTDDYLLYPVDLNAGDYLQVKLALPDNPDLDYDLLVFDSSLSLIKSSDYVTCITSGSDRGTLDESIGYYASSDESIYVGVYSVSGGSETETYTLDYTITKNFAGSNEPDENAKESGALTLGTSGANITGELNSPLDNDWYSFTVIDDPTYDKVRFNITSSSTTNGCQFELYRNLVATENYYGMQYLGYGNSGETELPAGTYYLRIMSTNTFENFNAGDIPEYKLSVVPVSRVDEIRITEISAAGGTRVSYSEGYHYRVDQSLGQTVRFKGVAYYKDELGIRYPAVNARLAGEIEDRQWSEISRPDMAWVYSSAVTDSSGSYSMVFNLKTARGGLRYPAIVSTHYYDLLEVKIYTPDNENINVTDKLYYLKFSDLY